MKKTISVNYLDNGLPYIKLQVDAHLTFELNDKNEVVIVGNRAGLRLLAKSLLGMAEINDCNGYHIHLDDLYEINKENKTFTICNNTNDLPTIGK